VVLTEAANRTGSAALTGSSMRIGAPPVPSAVCASGPPVSSTSATTASNVHTTLSRPAKRFPHASAGRIVTQAPRIANDSALPVPAAPRCVAPRRPPGVSCRHRGPCPGCRVGLATRKVRGCRRDPRPGSSRNTTSPRAGIQAAQKARGPTCAVQAYSRRVTLLRCAVLLFRRFLRSLDSGPSAGATLTGVHCLARPIPTFTQAGP